MSGLGSTIADAEVVICTGAGGVGKTTTAAAIGLAGAHAGRRVIVVTIDPARRLAEALGLGARGLGDTPTRIEGSWDGELWASMLDPSATFDGLVRRYAPADQADRILANPLYRNLADALPGTQEYMAAEKLYELAEDPRFDLVVVDTPPTRNAIDFLDAPSALTRFLDHRLYRILMAPTRRVTRTVGLAASAFVRTVSKVVGSAVVEEAVAFFQAFEGLEDGFRQRAHQVDRRFRSDTTAFVLVTSPRRDVVGEARWFARTLRNDGMAIRGVVVNRVVPRPIEGPPDRFAALARDLVGTELAAMCELVVAQADAADLERAQLAPLLDELDDAAVVVVPTLGDDVHDLAGLERIASLLVDPAARVH